MLHVHSAHATHSAARRAMCMLVFFRRLSDHDFRREQQTRNRGGVQQSQTRDLGRIQDAHFEHIAVLIRRSVVAEGALALTDSVQHHRGVFTGVRHNLTQWLFDRAGQDLDARRLVIVGADQFLDGLERAQKGHAAARNHALFDGRTSRMQSIFDAGLLFLHFDFGRSTDLDQGYTAGELGYALLQFLLVVIGSRFLDLLANAVDPAFDVRCLAGAVDDRGVLFLDQHLLRFAEIAQRRLLERQADFIGNDLAARQDRDVLQHGLATIAEARRLDGGDLDDAANGVDDEGGKRLALDVFGDDQQLAAALGNGFEQRQQFANVGDLLIHQQDQRLVELGALALLIADEIRRQIPAIELHAFDHFEFVFEALTLFDRDHAFLAYLRHRVGNRLANALVGVRGDRADLRNRFRIFAGLGELLELFRGRNDRLVDAALQIHRIRTRSHRFQALADDGLREHGGGGGAVTGFIGSIRRHFPHHLRAHVLELVFEFDLLGDRDTVLRDGRGAIALVEHCVAALGTQRYLDGIRQNIHALEHALPGVVAEAYVFCCHLLIPLVELVNDDGRSKRYLPSITAMTSSSRMTTSSSPSIFTSVPLYLPKRILSPTLRSTGRISPFSKILPLPTATTFPKIGFSVAVSGITMPPADLRSSSSRFTITRS